MKTDLGEIKNAILKLEVSLNERWSTGDSSGFLDCYHDDITYFDPVVENQLVGRTAVVEHLTKLYKNPNIVRNEYLNPHVIVSVACDIAVLSYNLNTFVLDDAGKEKLLRAWNSTEVYKMFEGKWRIVHSNWGLTKSLGIASAS